MQTLKNNFFLTRSKMPKRAPLALILFIVFAVGGAFTATQPAQAFWPFTPKANITRVTGVDMTPCVQWSVCGTDLGIPYKTIDGSVGYIFGDTFSTRNPEDAPGNNGWRSPVILRAGANAPASQNMFTSAAGVAGNSFAPGVLSSKPAGEFTAIPNDGISIPELGIEVLSYQSIRSWNQVGDESWQTNFSGLAVSTDGGNHFERNGPVWTNDANNNNAYQMTSMQRDGVYVYMISVPAGRQNGSMMLQRVPATQILNKSAYQCWSGSTTWGGTCKALLKGRFGEPSLRKLADGTWVMAYLDISRGAIVTRTAKSPQGTWSSAKSRLTGSQLQNLYGGFIDPYSTKSNLRMSVSTWQRNAAGQTIRYDTNILKTSL